MDTLSSKLFAQFCQQGITPTFGYDAPYPSTRGTLTLLTSTLPSAHYESLRPTGLPRCLLQSEFRFKEGFARPLTHETRVVVCAGSRILLFRRTAIGGPGYGQYDVPVEGSSFSLYGENDGFQIYYPGIDDLLVDDSIRMRLVNEATGPSTVRLYDIDDDRENDFFGFQNGWHQLPAISGFDERAALLRTPLIERRYPSIVNDRPQLVVPEWVEFDLFPKIEFFGRGTSLYLERVLGEIPVLVDGKSDGVGMV
jgi:hypothetical protein